MNTPLSEWLHVDFSRTQWKMLWQPWNFYWEEDITPFSSRGIQVWALIAYFTAIVLLWVRNDPKKDLSTKKISTPPELS
jgi:hypothetical protein